jgi:polar amino acid transport system substrate-binding protein
MRRAIASLALIAALTVVTSAGAERPPTKRPGELVVALDLAGSSLQAGAVRGKEVVLAKGFEVDLARAVARRLGVARVTFVEVPRAQLVAPGRKTWDLGLAALHATGRGVDFSRPYLREAHAVVARRGLPRPRSLAMLRGLQLCAERRSESAVLVSRQVRPTLPPLLAGDAAALVRRIQTGACDAGLVPVTALASALAGRRDRLGPIVGRIDTDVAYAIALERRSPLTPLVNRALRSLQVDGTLARLRGSWLGGDPLRLPALR